MLACSAHTQRAPPVAQPSPRDLAAVQAHTALAATTLGSHGPGRDHARLTRPWPRPRSAHTALASTTLGWRAILGTLCCSSHAPGAAATHEHAPGAAATQELAPACRFGGRLNFCTGERSALELSWGALPS